jgi:hypothetical protein
MDVSASFLLFSSSSIHPLRPFLLFLLPLPFLALLAQRGERVRVRFHHSGSLPFYFFFAAADADASRTEFSSTTTLESCQEGEVLQPSPVLQLFAIFACGAIGGCNRLGCVVEERERE